MVSKAIVRIANQDTLSTDWSTATTPGNLLVAATYKQAPTGSVSIPGWTLVIDQPINANASSIQLFTKISTGDSTTTITGAPSQYYFFEYVGATATQDGTAEGNGNATSTGTTISSTGLTLSNPESLIIVVVGVGAAGRTGGSFTNSELIANGNGRIFVGQWFPHSTGAKADFGGWVGTQTASVIQAAFLPGTDYPSFQSYESIKASSGNTGIMSLGERIR